MYPHIRRARSFNPAHYAVIVLGGYGPGSITRCRRLKTAKGSERVLLQGLEPCFFLLGFLYILRKVTGSCPAVAASSADQLPAALPNCGITLGMSSKVYPINRVSTTRSAMIRVASMVVRMTARSICLPDGA